MFFTKPWADALIVLLVIMLFFGPKRLPSLGRSLGEGMREFKDSITGKTRSSDEEEERPALPEASSQPVPAAPAPAAPAEPAPAAVTEPAPAAAGSPEAPQVASSERRS